MEEKTIEIRAINAYIVCKKTENLILVMNFRIAIQTLTRLYIEQYIK